MKSFKRKDILCWIFLLTVACTIEEKTQEFATSHVSLDLKEVPKTIIDLLNQSLLMKKYAKTPPNQELCQYVTRNVS